MTVSEMHTAFRLHLDKSSSLVGIPDFLPEEIDFWLNEAQDRFIKQRMFGDNYMRTGLEQNQKRIDDLRNLVILLLDGALTASDIAVNVKEYTLPINDGTSPYMFYISSTVYKYTTGSGHKFADDSETLQVKDIIQHERLKDYLKDGINDPYIRRPLVTFYGDKIAFIYGDEFVPTTCDITYLKRPKKLVLSSPTGYQTTTCELAVHTHPEIAVMAADLVIENTESPRVQTFEQLNASKVE